LRGFVDYTRLNRFILANDVKNSRVFAAPARNFAPKRPFLTAKKPENPAISPFSLAIFPKKTPLLLGKTNPFVMGNATFSLDGFLWKRQTTFVV
jgi:hypothetical protein